MFLNIDQYFKQLALQVDKLVDEMNDIMNHLKKLSKTPKHKATLFRFKNKLCDINSENRQYNHIYKDLLLKYDPLELKKVRYLRNLKPHKIYFFFTYYISIYSMITTKKTAKQ